jgi:glycosyltransferase involved in cell wall biosynthesis
VSAPGPHVTTLRAGGIDHVALTHATRAVALTEDVRALGELYGVLRRLRPDIVHTHNPKPGIYGRLAARAARVPVVVNTVHGLYAQRSDRWRRRLPVYGLERLAATCSQAELVQSREDLETLRRLRVPAERLHHLGNGIDLDRFDPARVDPGRVRALRDTWGAGAGEIVCGVVGRLVREKGLVEVVDAADLLRERCPEVRVVVVGPDDDAKVDAFGAPERRRAAAAGVVLAGPRDDMVDVYGAFDLYLLASHREGMPRSAMEAAAMGCALVLTDVRGCREVVDHQRTGLLVDVADPASIADAVGRLAGSPSLRADLAAAARTKALRDFDQRDVVARTLDVYARLLAERT